LRGGERVSLHKRLERLEASLGAGDAHRSISRAALATLPDEDLDALEDVLEAAEAKPGEDLRAGFAGRGRRALDAYTYALEAVRRSRERRGA
jgi:hypothetical protein